VRSATTSAAEGETNLDRVAMRIEYFAALAEGYLSASCGFLTETEIEHLAVAGRVITVETGLRFLTDYLCGDTYFRTHRPQQNLERCRTQFALARSIDAQLPEMRSVVAGISAGLRERPES
jgi:hypothetical protein